MPRNGSPDWDRAADLAAIEATYDEYAKSRRSRLWDVRSPGYGMLVDDLRRRLMRALGNSASRASRVLDLGCGTGELAMQARGAGIEAAWTGLDLRADAVDAARMQHPWAEFLVGSADDVPRDDGSFDVVVAQVLFSSLPSRRLEESVAREIGRLLGPDGWLVWLDIRYDNPTNRAVHGLSRQRISNLFPDWSTELELAGLLPPVARRLGPTARLSYPALSAVPPLRSHLVGRLRRPAPSS